MRMGSAIEDESDAGSRRRLYSAPSHSIPRLEVEETSNSKELDILANDVEYSVYKPRKYVAEKGSLMPWRWFRAFVALTRFLQDTRVKVLTYAILYVDLVCLFAYFLIETAAHRNDSLTVARYIVMSTFALSGLVTTTFLAVGLPFLYPSRLLWTSIVDFAVWVTFIVVALLLEIHWKDTSEDEDDLWISVLGFVLVIRLNTFAAFNMKLGSLVFKNDINPDTLSAVGVPLIGIEKIVVKSDMSDRCKQHLLSDLRDSDVDRDGKLDRIEFSYFIHGSIRRNFALHVPCSDDKRSYQELLTCLDFDALVPEEDVPYLRDGTNKNDDIFSTVLLASHLLFRGQRLLGLSVVLALGAGAFVQPAFVVLVGKLVNLAVDMASMSTQDEAFDIARHQLMLGIVGLILRWLIDEILSYYSSAVGACIIANATARVQLELARCALYGDIEFEDKYNCGSLSNVLSASLSKTEQIWIHLLFRCVWPVAQLISAVIFLAFYDVSYAFFVFSVFPVITSFRLLEDQATNSSADADTSSARLLTRFQNAVNLQTAAKVCNSEAFVLERFKETLEPARHDNFKTLFWSNMVESVFATFVYGLNTITTIVFLFELADGRLDAGSFFAVTGLVRGVIWPVEAIGVFLGEVARKAGAVYKIDAVLTDGEAYDKPDAVVEDKAKGEYKLASPALDKALTLDSVRFSYGRDSPVVLKDTSVSISSGTYVCFLGKSGSGKSTLLSLLTGRRSCNSGRILMDGVDISTMPVKRLRDSLGVVFQETYVLDGTIFDNIAFGCVDRDEDWDEAYEIVTTAAKDADIHDFIETLPAKYETVIGKEAKISLSGGQLQRICGVARALARRPKLLILDECTSSLDKITEFLIIKTMERLRDNGLTIISFTHNPATAKHADNIVVLDKGIIAQTGRYYDLRNREGLFSSLIQAERRKDVVPDEDDDISIESSEPGL